MHPHDLIPPDSQARRETVRQRSTTALAIRVGLFVLLPIAGVVGYWQYHAWQNGPAGHPLCVAQAEHRIRTFEWDERTEGIAATRKNMVEVCDRYWSRGYVQCLLDGKSAEDFEACEKTTQRVSQ